MTSASPEFVFEELLEHQNFVRNTLRGLLADESRVQDLAQETWLRVLQRRPPRLSEPRAWLGRVARNLALSSWRSDARRVRREHERATDGSTESIDLGHERLELRQRVVAAVLELEDPYRTVVVLRYEHGQTTGEIAQRLARPEGTVRSQLSRAHELLRVRLDGEFGGRERWAALALPAASAPASGLAGFLLPAAFLTALAAGAWLLVRELGPAADSPVAQALVPGTTGVDLGVEPESAALQGDLAEGLDRVAVGQLPDEQEQRALTLERLLTAAVLSDRSYFDDYERATFSFEYGLRDDPELVHTHNDWEIHFDDDVFSVNMVTDDHSVIADLGRLEPGGLGRISVASIRFTQTAPVQVGHAYYIGTRDTDTDLATFVFVRSHEPGRTCTFDWYTTDGTGRAQGSICDTESGLRLVEVLTEIRRFQREGSWLQNPRVVLQVRAEGSGNPNRINIA
ncbi:MAG: RNA polymerase sigma factor, partial [Planctomycetota bacterium]